MLYDQVPIIHRKIQVIRLLTGLTSSSEEGDRSETATGTGLSWTSVGMVTTLPVTACCVLICSSWFG